MGQGTGYAPYKNPLREEADFCITKKKRKNKKSSKKLLTNIARYGKLNELSAR